MTTLELQYYNIAESSRDVAAVVVVVVSQVWGKFLIALDSLQ